MTQDQTQSAPMNEVRYKLLVLGKAVGEYEEVNEAEVGARWLYEMKHRLTPKDADTAYVQMMGMQEKRAAAEATLLSLTGLRTVDEARDVYLRLLTAYNLWGELTEKHRLLSLRLNVLPAEVDAEAQEGTAGAGAKDPLERLQQLWAAVDRAAQETRDLAAALTVGAPSKIQLA